MTRQRTDALALYHNAVRDYPLLTAEEEVQLARAWREEGDKVAAEK
ncbi:MAG TPA: RNA polymerase subunit sigma, partial [Deltaproteobacteria bacterium]|nr:RNA polymerase subunit sigma [Deltaproteobacteria bacterium]